MEVRSRPLLSQQRAMVTKRFTFEEPDYKSGISTLLELLHLGIKGIRLSPMLPGFVRRALFISCAQAG